MITELPTQPAREASQDSTGEHVAYIAVSDTVLFQQLGIPFDLMDTQRQLRDAGVFAQLKEAFLLPASYTVVALMMHIPTVWWIGVISPDLPLVPLGELPTEITPFYTSDTTPNGDRIVTLTKIVMRRDGQEVNLLTERDGQLSRTLKGVALLRSGESDDCDSGNG